MRQLPLCLGLVLGVLAPAYAQAPSVSGVFPAGGQAGSTVECSLTGANLADAQAVLVSGAGVQVEKAAGGTATNCPIKLRLDPAAEVGVREIRVVTKQGASNAARIWVGRYPAVVEKEPNDTAKQVQPLAATPVTVDGRLEKATDQDRFSFDAAAGETWVFSATAAGYEADTDAYLTLYDARGRTLRFAMDSFGRDPRLVHQFTKAGRYSIEIRDTLFRGGPGFTYRLTVGKLPVISRWTPMAVERGRSVAVSLTGVNLGERQVQVAAPADRTRDRVRIAPSVGLGPVGPLELPVEEGPVTAEQEPNDAPKTGSAATLPLRAAGWIDRQGDRDVYPFTAAEKQVLVLDVLARRIGSRLDSVVRVLNAQGKELANNDDGVGRDARLTFTAPAAGTYFAEVRSLSGRGGDDRFYLLRVTEPTVPDFSLSVTPDNPVAPANAAGVITVTAQRAGYTGEIALRLEGLPAGVTASPATLRAGQNSAVLTLAAPAGAAFAYSPLRVIGIASVNGKPVERIAQPQESYQPPLAMPNQKQVRATELLLTTVGPEPPYTLTVQPGAREVKAGQKLELTVQVQRKPMYKEAVAVTVLGLPANVAASALTVNGDKTEGKITLTANGNAVLGPGMLVVQGNAKNILVAAPALPLNVLSAK